MNDLNRFVIATGSEGSALPTDNGIYLNDVEGLLLHEIGHTLGLGHSNVNAGVMCGYIFPGDVFNGSTCDYAHVNHQLDDDDRAGITTIYGASLVGDSSQQVPLPLRAQVLLGLVLLIIGVLSRRLQNGV